MAEQLVTEVLVQVDVQTFAVTVYVGALNLKGFKVNFTLILLKVIFDGGAYSGVVRLCLKSLNGQNDGQCRHKGLHTPGHTLMELLFELGQLVDDSRYLFLEILDESAVVSLGVTRLSMADAGNELIVNAEQVNNQLLSFILIRTGNEFLIY